jgi:hypothetical protein
MRAAHPHRDTVANFGVQAEVVCHAQRPDRVAFAVRHDVLDRVSDVNEKLHIVDGLGLNPTLKTAIPGNPNEFVDDFDGESLRRWLQLSDVVSDFGERGLGSLDIRWPHPPTLPDPARFCEHRSAVMRGGAA